MDSCIVVVVTIGNFCLSIPCRAWFVGLLRVGAGENPGHCVVANTFTAIVEAKEAKEVMEDAKGIRAKKCL